jgi:hypothetical protein
MNENVSKLARVMADHAVWFRAGDPQDMHWTAPTTWKAEAK